MSTAMHKKYQTKQPTACTLRIDRNLQRRRAVFWRQHGFLVTVAYRRRHERASVVLTCAYCMQTMINTSEVRSCRLVQVVRTV